MIKDLFINSCGEEIFKRDFSKVYNDSLAEYEKDGVFFLSEDYIRAVNQEADAYPRILDLLIEEADRIKKSYELSVYALFVCNAMKERELYKKNIKHFGTGVLSFLQCSQETETSKIWNPESEWHLSSLLYLVAKKK